MTGHVIHVPAFHSSSLSGGDAVACRKDRTQDQGFPCGARNRAALTLPALRLLPPLRALAALLDRRKAAIRLTAACLMLGSLCSQPSVAQQLDLKTGNYVAENFPCDDFAPMAFFRYTGRDFSQKRSVCAFDAKLGVNDVYDATCIEDNDPTSAEKLKWPFKLLSNTRFRLGEDVFRFCQAKP